MEQNLIGWFWLGCQCYFAAFWHQKSRSPNMSAPNLAQISSTKAEPIARSFFFMKSQSSTWCFSLKDQDLSLAATKPMSCRAWVSKIIECRNVKCKLLTSANSNLWEGPFKWPRRTCHRQLSYFKEFEWCDSENGENSIFTSAQFFCFLPKFGGHWETMRNHLRSLAIHCHASHLGIANYWVPPGNANATWQRKIPPFV